MQVFAPTLVPPQAGVREAHKRRTNRALLGEVRRGFALHWTRPSLVDKPWRCSTRLGVMVKMGLWISKPGFESLSPSHLSSLVAGPLRAGYQSLESQRCTRESAPLLLFGVLLAVTLFFRRGRSRQRIP